MAITLTLFKSQGSSDEILLPLRDKLIQLDLLSLIILIPTVVCLVLGLQWGGITYSWNDWRIILLFVLFGCLAITFGIVQWWQGDRATVPPRILLTRHILFGAWYSFNTSGALYVAAYYLPIWFQAIKDASALGSGVRGLPLVIALIMSIMTSGAITTWIGY